MTTVFVYEHLSGGAAGAAAAAQGIAELQAAGAAMRDAVVADLLDGGGFTVDVASPDGAGEPAPTAGGGAGLSPRAGEAAIEFVAREAARHDLTWVVAPETGGLLADLCAAVAPSRWLGCRAPAIAVAGRKRDTVQCLAARGLCTPLAFEADASTGRWVVKPDDGAGAMSTRQHRTREQATADAAARPDGAASVVIEPWVDGHPMSLSLLCSAGGTELLSVNRQLIGVDADGVVGFQRVDTNVLDAADRRSAPLNALARQVVGAIDGLRGFVGVDLVWHARRGPVVIEVNPRVTTAYVGLSALLARCLAADIVAAHLEEWSDGLPGIC